ncbi:hypothetical protein Goshw_006938 [Gossypium schwendimanii]|uniref:Uncharacterized protein n=1 Tax=Gossypium schwendimanii TaxID=34291 RepID=A0A7J9KQV0_GOSSC|nr:hypothetical protein [Gossypium schwendimanii]
MEGLIPFVYRAIIQYKNGRQGHHVLATWFNDSPSASYMRLPTGDSGRFQASDTQQLFQSEDNSGDIVSGVFMLDFISRLQSGSHGVSMLVWH